MTSARCRALVIDAHLHCTGTETTDGVLRALDDARIDIGVLRAPFLSDGYSMHDAASLRRGNAHLARLVRGHADRLVGLAVVNPALEGAPDDLRHAIDDGMSGAKMVPMPEDMPRSSVQSVLPALRNGAVDLLHAHLPNAHVLAGLAWRLAGKRVLTTIHGRQLAMADLEMHRAVGSHVSVVCRQSDHHVLGVGVDPALLSCEPNGADPCLTPSAPVCCC